MCAIYGIAFLKKSPFRNNTILRRLLETLAVTSQVRGRDATGLAFTSNSRVTVIKKNVKADEFFKLASTMTAIKQNTDLTKIDGPDRLISIIGHCRAQTKGTHEINYNNHPIVTDKVVGVHNGVIGNDERLFADYKKIDYIKRRGTVDSEVIFQLIDYFANNKGVGTKYGIMDATKKLNGSYACAMVNSKDTDVLWLFRKTNPTTIFFFPKCGMVMFASTKMFLIDTIGSLNLALRAEIGMHKEIDYPEDSAVAINLKTMKGHKFNLIKPKAAKKGVFGF